MPHGFSERKGISENPVSRDYKRKTAAAQLFAVKKSSHHLRDCIVYNRQPCKRRTNMIVAKLMVIWFVAVLIIVGFFTGVE